jgi:hypothetical protein
MSSGLLSWLGVHIQATCGNLNAKNAPHALKVEMQDDRGRPFFTQEEAPQKQHYFQAIHK